jgi:hypothetical protein
MTQPNDPAASPADGPGTPPEGAAGTPDPKTLPEGATGSGLDDAAKDRELARARKDAATYRSRLQEIEDSQKSEATKQADAMQKLRDENAALLLARRDDTLRLKAAASARSLGFKNPDIAYALIASSVEFDDEGQPKNVEKLLGEIAKSDAYLINGTGDAGLGPRDGPPKGTDMNALIRQAVRGH